MSTVARSEPRVACSGGLPHTHGTRCAAALKPPVMIAHRPTLVLLTLDAFAMMAWVRHMNRLFESGSPLVRPAPFDWMRRAARRDLATT